MARMNRVQLIGRLGQEPELRYLQTGAAVLNLSVATNDGYYDRNNTWIEKTTWHKVVCWGKLAERQNDRIHKGMEVLVEGSLEDNAYTDKEGKTRHDIHVKAMSVQPIGIAKQSDQTAPQDQPDTNEEFSDEDIPF
jgi:single-strand DNA-binding protein